MLNSFIQPSKALIVLLASCLFWVGGISLAVIWFAGTSVTTGWIVAGALLLALLIWLAVMSHEIRHALAPQAEDRGAARIRAAATQKTRRPLRDDGFDDAGRGDR